MNYPTVFDVAREIAGGYRRRLEFTKLRLTGVESWCAGCVHHVTYHDGEMCHWSGCGCAAFTVRGGS